MSEKTRDGSILRRTTYASPARAEAFIVPIVRDSIAAMLAKYASEPMGNAMVLDVGCGEQPLRADLEAIGYRYVSLDVVQNQSGTVDYVAPIDGELPRSIFDPAAAYDLVMCTEVLEHVADWQTAFMNMAALTTPGGVLLITCPHFYMLHEEPHDYWRPTLYAINHYSNIAGFEVIEENTVGSAWDILGTLVATIAPAPVHNSFVARILSQGVRLLQGVTRRILLSGWLQARVALKSKYYVTNVAVLRRKPSSSV